jgi:hypothetical protein
VQTAGHVEELPLQARWFGQGGAPGERDPTGAHCEVTGLLPLKKTWHNSHCWQG